MGQADSDPHVLYSIFPSPHQVLITIYWLGRRAQSDRLYDGPYLNFKAFEGLLGTALYKVKLSRKGSFTLCAVGKKRLNLILHLNPILQPLFLISSLVCVKK